MTTVAVVAALSTGLTVAGATAAPAQTAAVPAAVPAAPAPVTPADVAAAVDQLDGLAKDLMAKSGVPGLAVAVVYKGKQVYAKGFGVRKKGSPGKVDPDTVFQIASLSKPVGSTVVAHQVTKKVVSWDTPVRRHLPGFRLQDDFVSRKLTIGDLYAHRSGLPSHAGDVLEDLGYGRAHVLDKLRYAPLGSFRNSYAYTNFGLTAAAQSVAKAAGTGWAKLSRQTLYKPLKMTRTSSRFADYVSSKDRAYGHVKIGKRFIPKFVRDADPEAPAGGVSSSVNDLSKWLEMLLNDGSYHGTRIASGAALLPALSPQIVSNPPTTPAGRTGFYGYGFNVGTNQANRTQISHSGAFYLGAGSNFAAIPELDLGIVSLTNATPVGLPEALNAEFLDIVQFGSIQAPWWQRYNTALTALSAPFGALAGRKAPAHPAPAKALRKYVGTYHSDFVGKMRVVKAHGGLKIKLGPDPMRFKLRHWNGNLFVFTPRGENAPHGSVSKVRFKRFQDGRADRVTVEFYNVNTDTKEVLGTGRFQRVR
ncbi:MAG TPA: serine hydrolase [Candidatus Nanopelagicales bacterium]|nr:serine hydrolase [Candidatus Nanopelagicales bacterium]